MESHLLKHQGSRSQTLFPKTSLFGFSFSFILCCGWRCGCCCAVDVLPPMVSLEWGVLLRCCRWWCCRFWLRNLCRVHGASFFFFESRENLPWKLSCDISLAEVSVKQLQQAGSKGWGQSQENDLPGPDGWTWKDVYILVRRHLCSFASKDIRRITYILYKYI